MTTIGTVNIDLPFLYHRRGYEVVLNGYVDTSAEFNQMRELYAKTEWGTAVHRIPGERPYGEDLTADSVNTVLCQFTHGTAGKVQDGYYLLRPNFVFAEDATPEGHSYVYTIRLFFLGTTSFYQACYYVTDMETLDSDWDI